MRKIFPFIFIIAFWYFLFTDCAQIGSPTGGTKDTIPPVFIGSTPEIRALNFDKKKIIIRFDEFFVLKDLQQKFTISPPLETDPKVRIKNKSVIISMEDELRDSTTYTFDFADIIQDNNENNPIRDFEFVVSTWDKIDSLAIAGQVVNCFDLKPMAGVYVMLYKEYQDSTPYLRKPDYLCKTEKEGFFYINNISKANYRIFALQDATSNLLFDQPTELIAFSKYTFEPNAEIVDVTDTIRVRRDSIMFDSIFTEKRTLLTPSDVKLFMFTEDAEKQYIKTYDRSKAGLCTFIFNRTISKDFDLEPLNFEIDKKDVLFEISEKSDTINYWIADTLIANRDTLMFSVRYQQLDSMNNSIVVTDTLVLKFSGDQIKTKRKRRKKKDDLVELPKLQTELNIRQGQLLDLKKNVSITTDIPIHIINLDKIQLFKQKDTLLIPEKFDLVQDSVRIRKYYIVSDWTEDTPYQLSLDSLALVDIYGLTNDSTGIQFRTQKERYYGSIEIGLQIENVPGQVIIQLLKDETVLQEHVAGKSGKVEISTINPGNYRLKAIFDYNKNGVWDTGKYLDNRQPEPVHYYPDEIKVKTNFEYKLDWKLP